MSDDIDFTTNPQRQAEEILRELALERLQQLNALIDSERDKLDQARAQVRGLEEQIKKMARHAYALKYWLDNNR